MRTPQEIREAFNDRSELDGHTSFVLVGIGGAGMSGVARMLRSRGFTVRGTDLTESHLIEDLRKLGIDVHIGHTADVVQQGDAVVLSDAIPLATSPEVRRAKELGCPIFRRSQALGWLLKDKKLIAVTGTHGKTTTTGMIGAGMIAAGLDPTIVVGAEVPQFGGAVVEGKGNWAVVEACEAYDSFHDFDPTIVVLTNLELDHVDFHENWENLKSSVARFIEKRKDSAGLFFDPEDAGATEVATMAGAGVANFNSRTVETVYETLRMLGTAAESWQFTGEHNRRNANIALRTVSFVLCQQHPEVGSVQYLEGFKSATSAVVEFKGAARRLQVLKSGDIEVVDDYAHHPTEIKASIQALREKYADRRLVVVYQPHLYSRTKDLIPQFAAALDGADHVFLTDIYPAREDPIPGVSSLRIAEQMQTDVTYVPSRHLLPRKVKAFAKKGDVIVGMGAGNIESFAPDFIQELNRKGDRIAVVYGGDSAEREVSLLSGRQVKQALTDLGYDAFLFDATETLLKKGDLTDLQGVGRPDLAFLCVHGTHAEDGAIQGLFELLGIPYPGSALQSSAITMDKALTKQVLEANGIPTPKGVKWHRANPRPELPDLPVIVKPNAQGSTVGLSFVEAKDQLERAI
ncbi:MAG TPA: UDP-N-acetylmuramate--L-alanine ligase, partial [Fimbriimonadaceae bacterium]|nr:UDP-N-acetylmuramate--L-alanine ligase [Fimbriimonadaceae bacterium]